MIWQGLFSEPNIRDVAIGIVGGIIVVSLEKVFSSIVMPIYSGKTQNLPNFNGSEWIGYSDDEKYADRPNSKLKIRQVGNKIFAEVCRDVATGKRIFKYTGKMYGSQIVLEFFDEEGPGLIVGTMVLHIGSDLKTLRGAATYFHHDKGKVVSTFRTYRKHDHTNSRVKS